ncbi:hypothetical protein MM368_002188 [Escherichia coli]|nr:hypothetical protein [Escherichia coli]EFH0083919.1 hypothetical protein [Escherichia coli]EFK6385622.1 hypothetical protein [Escherichia coli]EFK6415537.1 hypothetical protein [Escherichia coli]EFL6369875.1 hypothetical protein [Escherichia coli]
MTDTTKFSVETKLDGLEALLGLLPSSLPIEQRTKIAVSGMELIKILKSQPPQQRERGQEMCEYIAAVLDNSINQD